MTSDGSRLWMRMSSHPGWTRICHIDFDLFPFLKQDENLLGCVIYASQFFIQSVDIASASMEIEMLKAFKTTAGRCHVSFLLVYNQEFIFDWYSVVVSSMIKTVSMITAVILVLLIPNPICSLWVTCLTGSVTTGVTGFMAQWDVSLDSISMIIFTICMSFIPQPSSPVDALSSQLRKSHWLSLCYCMPLWQCIQKTS